jgi:hypothetical protein
MGGVQYPYTNKQTHTHTHTPPCKIYVCFLDATPVEGAGLQKNTGLKTFGNCTLKYNMFFETYARPFRCYL